VKAVLYTTLAMLAFAANSILCRIALLEGHIDAGSFTLIRILSGAVTLLVFVLITTRSKAITSLFNMRTFVVSSISLFVYALAFSYAYINLGTGTGALILFGVVQLSMLMVYAAKGNHVRTLEWLGIALSIVGFLVLLLPSATRPDPISALLMAISGVSWAFFTLQGKAAGRPLISTTSGFLGSALLSLITLPWLLNTESITGTGLTLALASGVITSAVGYVIWYIALGHLTVLTASIVQLSVPAIALFGGLLLVGEPLTTNIIISTISILGGIALVFVVQQKRRNQ
jgi:drug/metabolite transporter (DMT)-like permease